MKVTGINPTLQVYDLKVAADFYTTLGFKLEWLWPDDTPTHGSVSSNGHSFMLAKIDKAEKPEIGDLYFRVDGVEELYNELKSKNIEVSRLEKTAYGMLDFSVNDPYGHHLVFGEPSGEWEG
ncbi:MAG: glyoxalase superfamily protein [Bacteroidota bacterium]